MFAVTYAKGCYDEKSIIHVTGVSGVYVPVWMRQRKKDAPAPGTALDTFYQAIINAQPADAEELILFEESNPKLMSKTHV